MEKVYTTPLNRKLGMEPGSRWGLWREPDGFRALLEPLPDGIQFDRELHGLASVVAFIMDRDALEQFEKECDGVVFTRIWFAWPKKTSRLASDIDFDAIQAYGLSLGLVDNKVCAIDADWTGLRFVPRKKP